MPCTRNQFKLAAILLMLIDHIGLFLLNNNILFRTVGRLAFPMFVYLLADGYHRTKDLKRYLFRTMSLFLISYFPYSLAMSGGAFLHATKYLRISLCLSGHVLAPGQTFPAGSRKNPCRNYIRIFCRFSAASI